MDEGARQRFHVPRVFDFIDTELDVKLHGFKNPRLLPYGIIVMEYVTGTSVAQISSDIRPDPLIAHAEQSSGKTESSAEEIAEKEAPFKNRVADAISFLLSFPPPSDVSPGPVGGGLIKNWAFGKDDSDAPREFANLEELNEFVNKKIVEGRSDMIQANLVPEGLKLCYCDLNLHNFIMEDRENPDSRIIIIDFEHANFLPHSFLTWEMWKKREFDMEERVRLQSNLTLSRDNVYAIHELCRVVTRQWDVTGYKD
ncbi:hypothetical protein K4K60_009233 [Colletotrichum sp. SAR11_57]|nr:hypothetical protein K4K60_009233 [Colletotrichum sp. SAR11_57]